jgi:hypothetical protein
MHEQEGRGVGGGLRTAPQWLLRVASTLTSQSGSRSSDGARPTCREGLPSATSARLSPGTSAASKKQRQKEPNSKTKDKRQKENTLFCKIPLQKLKWPKAVANLHILQRQSKMDLNPIDARTTTT